MLMTLKDMLSQTKQKSRKAIGGIGTAIIMMMVIINNNNKALTGMLLPFAHLLTAALLQTHVLEKELRFREVEWPAQGHTGNKQRV